MHWKACFDCFIFTHISCTLRWWSLDDQALMWCKIAFCILFNLLLCRRERTSKLSVCNFNLQIVLPYLLDRLFSLCILINSVRFPLKCPVIPPSLQYFRLCLSLLFRPLPVPKSSCICLCEDLWSISCSLVMDHGGVGTWLFKDLTLHPSLLVFSSAKCLPFCSLQDKLKKFPISHPRGLDLLFLF